MKIRGKDIIYSPLDTVLSLSKIIVLVSLEATTLTATVEGSIKGKIK